MTWGSLLVDQLDFYMQAHLLPRLEGLSADEYFWRPTASSCSVMMVGDRWTIETPGPQVGVPTIAWRLCHIAVSNLGAGTGRAWRTTFLQGAELKSQVPQKVR